MYNPMIDDATGKWATFEQWLDTDDGSQWLAEMAEVEALRMGWL